MPDERYPTTEELTDYIFDDLTPERRREIQQLAETDAELAAKIEVTRKMLGKATDDESRDQ